jgi:hypothetical protein
MLAAEEVVVNAIDLPYDQFVKKFPMPDRLTMAQDQMDRMIRDKKGILSRNVLAAGGLAAKVDAARAALAVERYRLKHGKLPGTWADLMPGYLPAPPKDPFLPDATLIFKPSGDGYAIYSVGPDGRDDGGSEGENGPPLDIVFRVDYPPRVVLSP